MASVLIPFTNGLVSAPQGVTDEDDCILVLAGNATIEGLLGNDKITALLGNHTIYGDRSSYVLEAIAPDNLSTLVTGNSITFGNDWIFSGFGNDIVSGDVGTIIFRAQAGKAETADSVAEFLANSVTTGQDTIWGDGGTDVLSGDVGHLRVEALGGIADSTIEFVNAYSFLSNNHFTMVADELHGGSGNDTLHGDVGLLEIYAKGGEAKSLGGQAFIQQGTTGFTPNTYMMGNDLLYGDSGNDRMYGDVGALRITAQGGTASGLESDASAYIFNGRVTRVTDVFHMGDDVLSGGDGNDVMSGDIGEVTIEALAGKIKDLGQFADGFNMNTLLTGVDTLSGEDGNDTLYGDLVSLSLKAQGGDASESSATVRDPVLSGGLLSYPNFGGRALYIMNEDNLSGGKGDDILHGDMGSLSILLQGGISVNVFDEVEVLLWGAEFKMGNDTLNGGDGNDILFGDLDVFTMNVNHGTGPGDIVPLVKENNFSFGDDQMVAGKGNDVMYGDLKTFSYTINSVFSNSPFTVQPNMNLNIIRLGYDTMNGDDGNDVMYGDFVTFTFQINSPTPDGVPSIENNLMLIGNDTLIGGAGDDILWGDSQNNSGVVNFLAAAPTNAVTWGDDILTGGVGKDKFAFALLNIDGDNKPEMQGNDIITDFVKGQDMMQFKDVSGATTNAKLATLNNATTFSLANADGQGDAQDTVITFHDGGSITLYDVNLVGIGFNTANTVFV